MLFRKTKRVYTPRVIQMEAIECGAASLSIVLQYHGKYIPLEALRIACGVSRDGSNAFHLLQAAEKYGLVGYGKKRQIEDLKAGPFPAILFWEFNHFLVIEGFGGRNKVYLNDPNLGRRHLSYDEFNKGYSGIALFFEPSEHFVPGGKPPSLIRQIFKKIQKIPKPISFLVLAGIFLLLPGVALPAFLMVFLNTFFSQNIVVWRWGFLGAVFITLIFSATLNWTRKYFLNRLGAHLSLAFSGNFLWHLLKLPVHFYNHRNAGEIAYRQRLNDVVTETFTNTLLSAIIDLFLILFYALLMFLYDPAIAWVGLIAGICNFGVLGLIYRSRVNIYARLQQNTAKVVRDGIGGLQQIETIKSRGTESDFFAKWAGNFTNAFNDRQAVGKKDVVLNTMPTLFQLLASSVLLGLGSYHIIEGSLSIGMLMAMQLLQSNFLQPISRFIGFNQLIQSMKVDLDRLDDVLENVIDPAYQEKPNFTKGQQTVRLKGRLEFKNVTFGYALLSPPIIENLSFIIEPGEKVAIAGASGSGKSTIAQLASRLLYPWSGQILLDDQPLETIPREILYNSLATADQDIFLFSGTIRENITLWNTALPDEILIQAAKDAKIHEEIVLRQGNYDSYLSEGGRNLSGGQRQRLEIARALLYNPPLLILDEAMSALDSKVEKEIASTIFLRGCSVLMISHRLSTIQDCHKILVLDRGKLVQQGTHEELKNIPGIYQELVLSESL